MYYTIDLLKQLNDIRIFPDSINKNFIQLFFNKNNENKHVTAIDIENVIPDYNIKYIIRPIINHCMNILNFDNDDNDIINLSDNLPRIDETLEFKLLNKAKEYNKCIIPFHYSPHFALLKNINIKNDLYKKLIYLFGDLLGMEIFLTSVYSKRIIFFNDFLCDLTSIGQFYKNSMEFSLKIPLSINSSISYIDIINNDERIEKMHKLEKIRNNKK